MHGGKVGRRHREEMEAQASPGRHGVEPVPDARAGREKAGIRPKGRKSDVVRVRGRLDASIHDTGSVRTSGGKWCFRNDVGPSIHVYAS